jgi:hypothetical protein
MAKSLTYCRREEVAHVRSAGFSRNPGEDPPKGGTTNGAFLAAGGRTPPGRANKVMDGFAIWRAMDHFRQLHFSTISDRVR